MYLMSQSTVIIFIGVLVTPACILFFYYFNNLSDWMLSWKKNKYVNMCALKVNYS